MLAVLGILLLRPVAVLLGAKGELLDYAVRYGRILMLALPPDVYKRQAQAFCKFTRRAKTASVWCCWTKPSAR